MKISIKSIAFVLLSLPVIALAADRDVQIQSVNFDSGVVQLTNLGVASESLSGWRFCTHNTSAILQYSSAGGLNGITIAPDASLYVHFNNDAAAADEINIDDIGGPFAALERDAYGMGLYINGNFGVGANIADHLQWSLGGVDNTSADERSDEAESGGVWVDQTECIATVSDSVQINLTDLSGAVLHSPANYEVTAPVAIGTIPILPVPFFVAMVLVIGGIAMRAVRTVR